MDRLTRILCDNCTIHSFRRQRTKFDKFWHLGRMRWVESSQGQRGMAEKDESYPKQNVVRSLSLGIKNASGHSRIEKQRSREISRSGWRCARKVKCGTRTNRKGEQSRRDGRGGVVRKRHCGVSGTRRRTEI
jgi:hypothetical protein